MIPLAASWFDRASMRAVALYDAPLKVLVICALLILATSAALAF